MGGARQREGKAVAAVEDVERELAEAEICRRSAVMAGAMRHWGHGRGEHPHQSEGRGGGTAGEARTHHSPANNAAIA